MSRMKRPMRPAPPLYLDVDDEPLPPSGRIVRGRWTESGKRQPPLLPVPVLKNPKQAPIRQIVSWSEKIAPLVDKALDSGDFITEVHCDGHRFVSLLTIDATGDNTLLYMGRGDVNKLIRKLERARDGLPQRKTTGRRKIK